LWTQIGLGLPIFVVDLSMPGYIKAALQKFQHQTPTRHENAPHTWIPSVYGAKTQYIEAHQYSPLLTQKDVTCIQQLSGTLLGLGLGFYFMRGP
jgi:hypothetical protein